MATVDAATLPFLCSREGRVATGFDELRISAAVRSSTARQLGLSLPQRRWRRRRTGGLEEPTTPGGRRGLVGSS